jgi:hypothetical protein
MKALFLILFLAAGPVRAQDSIVTRYFFGKGILTTEGCELMVATRDHWTDLSREIGYRVYSDPEELKYIEEHFYKRYRTGGPELHHFCTDDLFFYLKKGDRITYWRSTNSMCSISDISGGDDQCSNMEYLAAHGTKLSSDTLSALTSDIATRAQLREHYFADCVYSEEKGQYPMIGESPLAGSEQYTWLYYDAYIECTYPNDWKKTGDEMVASVLDSMGLRYDPNDARINWRAENDFTDPFVFTLYFTDDVQPLYDTYGCKPLPMPRPERSIYPEILIWRLPDDQGKP